MLHEDTLESYRRMTPSERLSLTFELIRQNTPYLFEGTPEQVDRRFELLRRENDARNKAVLEVFARVKDRS